jgi:hypothetical protein
MLAGMEPVTAVVRDVWDRAMAVQPAPSPGVVALTALAAAVLVLAPGAWPVSRHVVTIVHEGAHGLAAWATGRQLAGIRLHSDTSGVTVSRGRPRGAGMVLTAAAGYLGPAGLGLLAVWLLGVGRAVGLLWVLLLLLTLLLVQIRNWFGLWSVLVSAVAVFAVSWWLPPGSQSAFAYLVAWFLLLAAPRPVLELAAQRWRHGVSDSDADQLARLTGLPAPLWVGVFLVGTGGALCLGAWVLLSAALR